MSGQEAVYTAVWDAFAHLDHTQDMLAEERRSWRRWLLLPYIGFVIPVNDPAVLAQARAWQTALAPWLSYDPPPPDQLHITLHYVGGLATWRWPLFSHTWRRAALPGIAERVRRALADVDAFDVRIGPVNAFETVPFAEVQDDADCLRHLRTALRRALPRRARPATRLAFVPHMTLGVWGDQSVAPLLPALQPLHAVEPLPFHVTHVKFTVFTYDRTRLTRDILTRAHETVIAEYALRP